MHRSGTSALCAALRACGASFGSQLLQPMAGVNDEGFWEDTDVVALNEHLLKQVGTDWFSVGLSDLDIDWSASEFDEARLRGMHIVERGFGGGPLEAIKDPRLCITLPFWLTLCREIGVSSSVCVIGRAPIEVARSLHNRDNLPLGYGLRLFQIYRLGITQNVPQDTIYVTYDELLEDPALMMHRLAGLLPLEVEPEKLGAVVNGDLRRHVSDRKSDLLHQPDNGDIDHEVLDSEINQGYPLEQTLKELVVSLVTRGQELSRIGDDHKLALSTISERDQQIVDFDERLSELGKQHTQALSTLKERDQQIAEFDKRLSELGALHTKALAVIDERDSQLAELDQRALKMQARLERILLKPVIGKLFSLIWKNEKS